MVQLLPVARWLTLEGSETDNGRGSCKLKNRKQTLPYPPPSFQSHTLDLWGILCEDNALLNVMYVEVKLSFARHISEQNDLTWTRTNHVRKKLFACLISERNPSKFKKTYFVNPLEEIKEFSLFCNFILTLLWPLDFRETAIPDSLINASFGVRAAGCGRGARFHVLYRKEMSPKGLILLLETKSKRT